MGIRPRKIQCLFQEIKVEDIPQLQMKLLADKKQK